MHRLSYAWRRRSAQTVKRSPKFRARRDRILASNEWKVTMSTEDKLAIQEIIAKYSYAYDSKDAEAFAQLFVEDAIFEVIVPGESGPTVKLSSRVAIREWAVQRHELNAASQVRHYQSGILFSELTAETASTRTMLLLTRQSVPDAVPLLYLTGVYHDKWRKIREGWRIAHRTARVDRDAGFTKHWA